MGYYKNECMDYDGDWRENTPEYDLWLGARKLGIDMDFESCHIDYKSFGHSSRSRIKKEEPDYLGIFIKELEEYEAAPKSWFSRLKDRLRKKESSAIISMCLEDNNNKELVSQSDEDFIKEMELTD